MTPLEKRYFAWLCWLIRDRGHSRLLEHLFSCNYIPLHARDINRASDGIDLRYRFGYENRISNELISSELDTRKCSVLEMMVALATHIENDIMFDPIEGDRTAEWFWVMMTNLGLSDQTDACFDKKKITRILYIFQNGEYSADGHGGLFVLNNPSIDVRTLEIWDQMNRYMVEHYY